MIRPSPEIAAIVQRWTDLIRTHRVSDLAHFMSHSDALVYIGTADGETWRGQMVRDGIVDHMAEVPDFTEDEIEIDAYENGETGWANYKSRFTFHKTGRQGVHRVTFVFVLERGGWKMIQHHISQADSNVEKMGIEHSAFQSLIDAAQAEQHDFGSEGLASIMFTDIASSTALAEALGDRVWVTAINAHMALISKCVEGAGGQVVKSLGDGTMSVFSSARAAMTAAMAIQEKVAKTVSEPQLAVRIGIHTGEVIRSQDDFFGSVVNKAARIADLADSGEIRVSQATRLIADGANEFQFSEPAAVRLKGFDKPENVYVLG